MGRAGLSGGGRSSGSGGGRSSGGRSSAGRAGGFSGGGSSFGNGRGRGITFMPITSFSRNYYGRGGGGPADRSAMRLIVIIILLVFIGSAVLPRLTDSGVTPSTVKREPLPKGQVTETAYYTDELGWIDSVTVLEKGMKEFYDRTGVQPYVYITDTIPSGMTMDEYARELYSGLFEDEAHFLLLFREVNKQYSMQWVCGSQAKTVIDREAADIICDYVEKYYYQSDLSESEMFGKAFGDAAKRIMSKTVPPYLYVIGIAGAAVVVWIAFIWWKAKKKQKNMEKEQEERILNTPLESFGDKDLGDLEKKYTEK